MKRTSYIKECVDSIINMAHDNNINSPFNVLELFAGEGSIFTQHLAKRCDSVVGWEIKNEFAYSFNKNVPNGHFFCKDTINLLQQEKSDDFLIMPILFALTILWENMETDILNTLGS